MDWPLAKAASAKKSRYIVCCPYSTNCWPLIPRQTAENLKIPGKW